ncbi:MAG: DUF2760 domain-containing protein [Planctomycetes bacterium]|nr:DUF2760 domain-containing protein [Planctomycetota bacterium]MBL7040771.1 DUF2760 domain-containing protein [Pirellulaceae bacterium]
MRLILAFRVFFVALFDAAAAEGIRAALDSSALPAADEKPQKPKPARPETPKKPDRSEAITLLAALQREARFVDLTQESLDEYSDEQVGAAARDVLRDCRTVLDRLFKLTPVLTEEEGAEIEVPSGFDTGRYRLTGNVAGQPPFRGSLVHHGWEAAKCEVPQWSGSKQATRVIAPAEVQL